MENLFGFFIMIYVFQVMLLIFGMLLLPRKKSDFEYQTFVSIVVAARNEEVTIASCVRSLLNQKYDAFEVIVVDDRSTDQTGAILSQLAQMDKRLRLLRIPENTSGLTGKENALEQGIALAKGEIILLTDADGTALPLWAQTMVIELKTGSALVFGETRIDARKGFFSRFQALELLLLFKVAIPMARLGIAGSCMGNNLGFWKVAFEKTGGYRALGYEPAEDYALLRAFRKNGFKVSAIEGECLMLTKPEPDFQQWWQQRVRWLAGSMKLNHSMALFIGPVVLANMTTLACLCGFLPALGALLTLRFSIDSVLFLWRTPRELILWTPFVYAYYLLSTPIYAFLYFFKRKIYWKEEVVYIQ